jgi:hypothetical protein
MAPALMVDGEWVSSGSPRDPYSSSCTAVRSIASPFVWRAR